MISNKAFTLVELAIVMTIIGLLIGGILKGQELLQAARMTATVAQIKSYGAAVTTFNDTYQAMPGDMLAAPNRLPNCSATNACVGGDGDRMLGTQASADLPWYRVDLICTMPTENVQFWKHLGLANLIAGISPESTTIAKNTSHPTAKIGGTLHARQASVAANSISQGLILVLRAAENQLGYFTGISPFLASRLDAKMDDGVAIRGEVHAVSLGSNTGCGSNMPAVNNYYDATNALPVCDMMFRLAK